MASQDNHIDETIERDECFLHNKNLLGAIDCFLTELEPDWFKTGFKACIKCQNELDRNISVNIHVHMKSAYDVLKMIQSSLQNIVGKHYE